MSLRRAATAAAATLLLAAATAPAVAAPLDFAQGQQLKATCSDPLNVVTLTPLPGDGPLSPYRLSTGQLLLPTEFRLTSGTTLLKARHFVPDGTDLVVSRPARTSTIKCETSGTIGDVPFTAVITGTVVGIRR